MNPRPRLLVLASTFPKSASDSTPAFVRDLAQQEARSYDTTVLVPAVPGAPPRERSGALDVRRFRFFPRRWEDLADGAILENVRTRRSRLLQVPPFVAAEILAVRRLVRELRPDVIHVHWLVPQGLAAIIGAPGVPKLVTTLGGDLYGLRDPLSTSLVRAVVSRAGLITAMNEDMRRRIIALGADPSGVVVQPMGADLRAVRSVADHQERVPGRLLFVGRLVEKKGLSVLLEALRLIGRDDLELVVVGDGPLRGELERQAEGLPVSFLGALPGGSLAEQYGRASISVFPSVPAASGDQDGLPVALLEAMSAGCAVVVSDLPGLSEAVQDGRSGRVVASGDSGALASALGELLSDELTVARLGRGARERSETYSLEGTGRAYVALLDRVRLGRR